MTVYQTGPHVFVVNTMVSSVPLHALESERVRLDPAGRSDVRVVERPEHFRLAPDTLHPYRSASRCSQLVQRALQRRVATCLEVGVSEYRNFDVGQDPGTVETLSVFRQE